MCRNFISALAICYLGIQINIIFQPYSKPESTPLPGAIEENAANEIKHTNVRRI